MELSEININRITYSNLSYGNYQHHQQSGERRTTIQPSSYSEYPDSSTVVLYDMGKSHLYLLLLLSLIAWTINFFRVKNRLKAERREKEKILEQSRQKMAFFTNLSMS